MHIRTFIAALFTVEKNWKQSDCPTMGKWFNTLSMHTTQNNFQALKLMF
jgi:hypothetical protein